MYVVFYLIATVFSHNEGRSPEAAVSYSVRILVDTKGKITHSPFQNSLKETILKQGNYITYIFPPLCHKVYQIFFSYRSIRKMVCYHSHCLSTSTTSSLLEAPDLRKCWINAGRDLQRALLSLLNKAWESWWWVENEQIHPWYSAVFFSL